mmetsp:Transcript_19979/g.60389  ORF Transcript_19979/g.60389 Transcript_19979/m.60389 type:complete len:301 (+) Transcript_19979:1538-2440(+)
MGVGHGEDAGEARIVHSHELRLGGLLGQVHQPLDVLHAAEGLLPQLQIARRLELLEAGLQVQLLRFGQRQVRAVALVAVLVQVGQVVAQRVAQPAKFRGALVGQAEVERLAGRHSIQRLQAAVVSKNVQNSAVGFPQKLEPGGYQLPICAILALFAADEAQHELLGGGSHRLQVFRVQLVRLRGGHGGLGAVGGGLDEILDDLLQTGHVDLLANIAVVDEAVLGVPPLLQLYAQVHVLEHDRLQDLGPGAVALASDDIMQRLQRRMLLPHSLQLLRALQCILRLRESTRGPSEAAAVHDA